MKLLDLEKLYRFELESTPIHYMSFGVKGNEIYGDIKIHGLLKTMFMMPEDIQEKLLDIIENF